MKTYKFSSTLCCLIGVIFLANTGWSQERERRINREFEVSPSTKLRVGNQFGRIHINTWDRSQIQVEVVVRAEMRNEEKSQEFIDQVEIEISESSSMVSLRTDYGGRMNSRKGESFSVDYTISMPSTGELEVSNKFGDIYVGDLSGDLIVDLKYGNMKGDKLTGDSDIELGFSGANIEELGNTELEIKYSDFKVDKAINVDLDQQFSDIRIDELGDLDLRSKYGSVDLGVLSSVDGSAGFTDLEIREVIKNVELDLEYVGGFRIDKIRRGFDQVKIDAKYTTMTISIEEGAGGEFDGVFRYSDLNNRGDLLDLNYVVKDNQRSEYKGKFGEGGSSKISVNSGYGDLRLDFTN